MKPATMRAYPMAAPRSQVNLAFSAILFSFLGWLIMERWQLGARTGLVPQLVNTIACAPVMGCSLRRFYLAWPRHLRTRSRRPGARPVALAALFAFGGLFGIAAGGASTTLLSLLAAACCFTPWVTIRAHQQHLLLSFLAVAAGVVAPEALELWPGAARHEPSLMVVLPAAWCLWCTAAVLCIGLYGGDLLKKKGH